MDAPDAQSETVFRHLVQRNAINWHAKTYVSGVVFAGQSDGEMLASAQKWLDDLQSGHSSQRVELPTNGDPSTALRAGAGHGSVEIRRALLLVGSPETRKSTSGPFPIEGGFTFEAAEGGTKVTLAVEADMGGFFKMADPLVVRMIKKQFETDVSTLKDLLEAQA